MARIGYLSVGIQCTRALSDIFGNGASGLVSISGEALKCGHDCALSQVGTHPEMMLKITSRYQAIKEPISTMHIHYV